MDTPTLSTDRDARERLSNSLKHIVDEAEHLLRNAQRSGSEEWLAARDKFETRLGQARAELSALQDTALYQAKRAAHATDHAVHQHPYAAMGLSAGVGLLLGMLISRR